MIRPGRGYRIVIVLASVLLMATPAWAQGLNDVLANILSNNCQGLSGAIGPYSADLARLCVGAAGAGSTAGGTATMDIRVSQLDEERRLYRRLRERREQAASADMATGRGFSLFASADYQNFNKDTTRFETGYRQDTAGATVGGDYAFGTLAVLGAAVHYAHLFGDYDGVGGGYDHDRYGVSLYGSLTPLDNLFVEATVGYTRTNYSFDRRATVSLPGRSAAGSTSGDTDGDEFNAGVQSGYDFVLGRFTVGPRLGVNYRNTEIDAYAESGRTGLELAYERQRIESLTTVAGLFGSVAISTGIGVIVPQATADYIHEFLNDQRRVAFRLVGDGARREFRFQTDRPDRDYFIVGVGAVLVLPGGMSPFISYRELLGDSDRTSHSVTAGLRFTF